MHGLLLKIASIMIWEGEVVHNFSLKNSVIAHEKAAYNKGPQKRSPKGPKAKVLTSHKTKPIKNPSNIRGIDS